MHDNSYSHLLCRVSIEKEAKTNTNKTDLLRTQYKGVDTLCKSHLLEMPEFPERPPDGLLGVRALSMTGFAALKVKRLLFPDSITSTVVAPPPDGVLKCACLGLATVMSTYEVRASLMRLEPLTRYSPKAMCAV